MRNRYRPGDRVVYTTDKYTASPGPRAKNIFAAPCGESYQYQVEKYWLVSEVREDGTLIAKTRRGKLHTIACSDPRLRKATLLERLLRSRWFPSEVADAGYAA